MANYAAHQQQQQDHVGRGRGRGRGGRRGAQRGLGYGGGISSATSTAHARPQGVGAGLSSQLKRKLPIVATTPPYHVRGGKLVPILVTCEMFGPSDAVSVIILLTVGFF